MVDLEEDHEQVMRNGLCTPIMYISLIKNITTNLKPKITGELDKFEVEFRTKTPKISESKIK